MNIAGFLYLYCERWRAGGAYPFSEIWFLAAIKNSERKKRIRKKQSENNRTELKRWTHQVNKKKEIMEYFIDFG